MNAREIDFEPQYTQVLGCDPFFVDIRRLRMHLDNYTREFPDLKTLLDAIEILYEVRRNEFNRLQDLAIGFIRSVKINNFEQWKMVTSQRWNRCVLTHPEVPQEYYEILLATANQIRNEFFLQEPIFDGILSHES